MKETYIPVGWKILIETIEKETEDLKAAKRARDSGFIIPDFDKLQSRAQLGASRGKVVAIGDFCWKVRFETTPWCEVGDIVEYVQYAGRVPSNDPSGKLRFITDEDLIAVVKQEE